MKKRDNLFENAFTLVAIFCGFIIDIYFFIYLVQNNLITF